MAFSIQEWEIVRAFYERGFSLSEIVARPEVRIRDRTGIGRRAKKEGWIKGEKTALVEKEIELKQGNADVFQQKSTLKSTELLIHDTIVHERTMHITYFNNSQMRLSQIGMQMVEDKLQDKGLLFDESGNQVEVPKLTALELQQVSNVVKTSREGILGKEPGVVINNSNDTKIIERIELVSLE